MKIHHRIPTKDIGTTVVEAGTLSKAFAHLAEVAKALRALHAAGWVHRDVSVGNIVIQDGVSKLADIEYAKHENDDTPHVRTGTAYFMAVEVRNGRYNFLRRETAARGKSSTSVPLDVKIETVNSAVDKQTTELASGLWDKIAPRAFRKREKKSSIDFRYNPLHDMESLLWLAFYLILCTAVDLQRTVAVSDEQWRRYQRARDRLAGDLFHNMNTRTNIIHSDTFTGMLGGLHPQIQAVCEELDDVRGALSQAYWLCERDRSRLSFAEILSLKLELPWDPDKDKEMNLHLLFATQFTYISQMLDDVNDIAFRS